MLRESGCVSRDNAAELAGLDPAMLADRRERRADFALAESLAEGLGIGELERRLLAERGARWRLWAWVLDRERWRPGGADADAAGVEVA